MQTMGKRKIIILALFGITAFGAALRYGQITTLPPGYWSDEAYKSIGALEIVRGLRRPIYVTDNDGLEAGYFWLLAGWFKLFGPSYFGTRALAALLGTLTIPITYWTARTLYRDHPLADGIGLLSAGLLAALFWHVHYSRFGIETIMVPMFSVATLGLLAHAWRKQQPLAFATAGAALGFSQYTNPGARVLPLQALVVFALLAEWQRPKIVKFGASFLIAAALVYSPLGWFFFNHSEWFFRRMSLVSTEARAGGFAFYTDNLAKTLLSFNFRGDVMLRHNLSLRPALDPLLSIWMWLGLGSMLSGPRRTLGRSHAALLAALSINLIPTIFSDGAPGFGRALGAAPLLVILPAFGVISALERASRHPQLTRWQTPVTAVAAATLLLSAAWNIYDYFVRYPRQPGMFDSFEVGQWQLIQSAAQASAAGPAYLIVSENELYGPALRLARELTEGDLRIVNGQQCFVYPERTSGQTVFAALPEWIPKVEAQFRLFEVTDILHEPEVYRYASVITVPAGQVSALGSGEAVAQFGGVAELLAAQPAEAVAAPGAAVPINLSWRALARTQTRYITFIHLVGADTPIITGIDGEPCAGWYPTPQWRAGEIVEYQQRLTLPADLPAGDYALAVGMYEWPSGERLPISQPNQIEADRAFVGYLVVK